MLLLVTVISLGARAQKYNLSNAIITGVHSQLLKGTDNSYEISYTVKCEDGNGGYDNLIEEEKTGEYADYYVEIKDSKGQPVPEEIIKKNKNTLTIYYSTENYPLDDYTLASYTFNIIATDYNEGSKTVNFSVIRFPTSETEDGSASHPFVIKKLDKDEKGIDLKLFSECVNAGISFKDEFFKLGTDLDYKGIAYIPIGGNYNSEDKFFEGSFDGDGHTIKGVNIDSSSGDIGLFGGISKGAEIKNLTLDNASITGLNVTGGIVGCNTGGTITNCHVTSSVTIQANGTNGERFGGIVGNNGFYEKDGTKGKVSNCSSAATLQGANRLVGGIAGSNEPGCTLSNNVVVGASISANNNYGAIAGINQIDQELGIQGKLDHNYYADCTGTNIGGCDGADVNEEDGAKLSTIPYVVLYNGSAGDNNATIEAAIKAGGNHNVILAGRTLYKDGKWNTLCLPFSMTNEQIAASDLAGATIMRLDCSESSSYTHVTGFESETGTLHLNFTTATNISAGTPYIIKWANGNNLVDPVFSSVNVTNAGLVDNIVSNDGYLKFKGTYSPKNIYTADKTFLYLGSDNKLYYPSGENMTSFNVNACRAYFELLNDLTAGDPISGVRSFRLNFDGDPTGITTTNYTNFTNSEDTWYDLQGRRIANGKLSNGKLPKGLYIHNGRKVVIK